MAVMACGGVRRVWTWTQLWWVVVAAVVAMSSRWLCALARVLCRLSSLSLLSPPHRRRPLRRRRRPRRCRLVLLVLGRLLRRRWVVCVCLVRVLVAWVMVLQTWRRWCLRMRSLLCCPLCLCALCGSTLAGRRASSSLALMAPFTSTLCQRPPLLPPHLHHHRHRHHRHRRRLLLRRCRRFHWGSACPSWRRCWLFLRGRLCCVSRCWSWQGAPSG
jgi:hypothetical protein